MCNLWTGLQVSQQIVCTPENNWTCCIEVSKFWQLLTQSADLGLLQQRLRPDSLVNLVIPSTFSPMVGSHYLRSLSRACKLKRIAITLVS